MIMKAEKMKQMKQMKKKEKKFTCSAVTSACMFIGCFIGLWSQTLLAQSLSTKAVKEETAPQIKVISYHPNQVISLEGRHFIATSIQFAKQEKIIGVYIGDMVAWTYAINPSTPYILFLKPTLDVSDTNMSVITNQHMYHFHLVANKNTASKSSAIYNLQFHYEPPEKIKTLNHHKEANGSVYQSRHDTENFQIHTHYSSVGSKEITPLRIFDDGKFTYFEFLPTDKYPAIFEWENSHEKLVNTQTQGTTIIAKCIASTFLLVKDDEKVWVENKN